MPVGTSGCADMFAFWGGNPPRVDRWVGCPPIGLGVKRLGGVVQVFGCESNQPPPSPPPRDSQIVVLG